MSDLNWVPTSLLLVFPGDGKSILYNCLGQRLAMPSIVLILITSHQAGTAPSSTSHIYPVSDAFAPPPQSAP